MLLRTSGGEAYTLIIFFKIDYTEFGVKNPLILRKPVGLSRRT